MLLVYFLFSQRYAGEKYHASARHTLQKDPIPYNDDITAMIGAKPSIWKHPDLAWRYVGCIWKNVICLSFIMKKSVLGCSISDHIRLKQACSVTDLSKSLEILDLDSLGIRLSRPGTRNVLFRLHR